MTNSKMSESNGYVIYHEADGVYLGHFLGMGVWSKLDPAGQDAAPVFFTVAEAEARVMGMAQTTPRLWFSKIVPVEADVDGHYASIQACIKAGLHGWDPDSRPIEVGS